MSKTVAKRKPTNVSLDSELVEQARDFGINISRACEQGLATEIAKARADAWRAENAKAIASFNRYVEENGLPLARYRMF